MKTLTKTNRYLVSNTLMYWPLVGSGLSLLLLTQTVYAVIPLAFFLFKLFHNSLNVLQVVGPIYWIYKDKAPNGTPTFARGFMHETSEPWRVGKGIQMRCADKTFQVGICHKQSYSETDGVLSAVRGRFLDLTPIEIRERSTKTKES